MHTNSNTTTNDRLIARVLREVLATERFETIADLKDALKARCARLRIRYQPDDITRALDLVESNRPLVQP
jgi:hypothetical protein